MSASTGLLQLPFPSADKTMSTKIDKRTVRRIKTRQAFFDAAVTLFSDKGLEATTMEDIAKAAGAGRSTLFLHFETKLDILKEFYLRFVEEVVATARERWIGEYREDLDCILEAWGDYSQKHRPIVSCLASLAMGHGPLAPTEEEADRILSEAFSEVASSAPAGTLRDDLKREEHVALLIAMLTVTSHDWVNGGMDGSLTPLLLRRFSLLHEGLQPAIK